MANQVAALALDKEGCEDHEYCYGNVSIVLGATAAEGAVRCHQQTGRASWSNLGSWGQNPFGIELHFNTDSVMCRTVYAANYLYE
jgi:hypothetical protein